MIIAMMKLLVFLSFLGALVASGEVVELNRREQPVEGWRVRVDERLLEGGEFHDDFGERALAILEASLVRIAIFDAGASTVGLAEGYHRPG